MVRRDEVIRLFDPYWTDQYGSSFACGDGWLGILADLAVKFGTLDQPVKVYQVKEKFGTLRVSVIAADPRVRDWISAAEQASGTICELCGDPGALGQRRSWWSTRCGACEPEGWEPVEDEFAGDVDERLGSGRRR